MGDAAAAFIAGHAAARSNGTVDFDGDGSARTLSLARLIEGDVRVAIHTTQSFFSEFLPHLFLIVAIVLVTWLVAWIFIRVWGALLRQCAIPEHYVRLTQYFWWSLFFFLAIAAAFGAAGVDFGHIFIGFGLFGIAFSAGASSTIANAFAGIMLQTHDLFSDHERVTLANGQSGEIIRMRLLYTELLEDRGDSAADKSDIRRTLLVPNTMLTDQVVEVQWHTERTKARVRQQHTTRQFPSYPTSNGRGRLKRAAPRESSKQELARLQIQARQFSERV